ncbi:hypothetical protein vseg_016287 [Gypsophila vaccaria]
MAADTRGGRGSTTTNHHHHNNNNNNDNDFIQNNNNNNNNNNNGGRSLHNFSLPPCLSWGTQRLLRCSNSTPSLNEVGPSSKRPRHCSPQYQNVFGRHHEHPHHHFGIDVVREKLMLDLRSEVDIMRAAFLSPPPPPPPPPSRWNLRTRRPAADDPPLPPPPPPPSAVRAKFSVALTREEVEEDFVAMVGRRPPRKPKKRPRYIHKDLETIFPGVWLTEVTAEMYKVNETPEAPKVVFRN